MKKIYLQLLFLLIFHFSLSQSSKKIRIDPSLTYNITKVDSILYKTINDKNESIVLFSTINSAVYLSIDTCFKDDFKHCDIGYKEGFLEILLFNYSNTSTEFLITIYLIDGEYARLELYHNPEKSDIGKFKIKSSELILNTDVFEVGKELTGYISFEFKGDNTFKLDEQCKELTGKCQGYFKTIIK